MVKPEWGTKRLCKSCGAKFYDLQKSPIVCPRCDTVCQPETASKPRRAAPPPPAPPPPAKKKPVADVEADGTALAVGGDDLPDLDDDDEDEGNDIIEDASELGEDEDDMADVIESSRDEEET